MTTISWFESYWAGMKSEVESSCALPITKVTAMVSPSARPRPSITPPTTPLPVMKQLVPFGVWSSSGWAAVPTGSAFTQKPAVAVSPGAESDHPPWVSQWSSTVRAELVAANMSVEEMRGMMGATSLAFLSVDGLYRAMGYERREMLAPQFSDHCFTGDYPTELTDLMGGPDPRQLSLLSEVS